MKLGKRARRRLSATALAAGPVALLGLIRLVFGSDPAAAPAASPAQPPTMPVALPTVTAAGSPAQQRALAWIRTHRGETMPSPMDHPKAQAMELPTQPQPGLPPASTKPEIAPVVSAIVRRGDSAKALIDGRVVGIGDEVLPGWIIEHIDVREQVVTLRNAAGKQRELSGKRGPAGPSK